MAFNSNSYFYTGQLKKISTQFVNIFSNLLIKMSASNSSSSSEFIKVQSIYEPLDRVVANLMNSNTSNKMIQLPIISSTITALENSPDRRVGNNVLSRQRTGSLVNGVTTYATVYTVRPHPIKVSFKTSILASNQEELFQILEQLWLIFDPNLQLQISNAPLDSTRIVEVQMLSLAESYNMPLDVSPAKFQWDAMFTVDAWIPFPMEVRDNIINSIRLDIGELAANMQQDQQGNIIPFIDPSNPSDGILDPIYTSDTFVSPNSTI